MRVIDVGFNVSSAVEVDLTAWTGAICSTVDFVSSGAAGSSSVECLPIVQGGIDKNSSKVRTRGLQHFHPVS